MKLAVVGHVEWVEFARVERVPTPGEIVHATETWAEAGGGGAVAAAQLARLAGSASLFTVLGDDALGARAREQLERQGVTVHAEAGPEHQRRAFTFVDGEGERTITVLGDKRAPQGTESALPWEELAECDGVYFVSGGEAASRRLGAPACSSPPPVSSRPSGVRARRSTLWSEAAATRASVTVPETSTLCPGLW